MASETLHTTEEVISALGGTAAVAELMNCSLSVVSNWKKAATFPARSYVRLSGALTERGQSAPASLWKMTDRVSA
jgi:hypothetical protein